MGATPMMDKVRNIGVTLGTVLAIALWSTVFVMLGASDPPDDRVAPEAQAGTAQLGSEQAAR